MGIREITGLLKKKGFRDTFQILTSSKDHSCEKHAFYDELNKFSYYNSYFRIKEDLIERGLIEIEPLNGKKFIKITKKGLDVFKKLEEINDLIEGN